MKFHLNNEIMIVLSLLLVFLSPNYHNVANGHILADRLDGSVTLYDSQRIVTSSMTMDGVETPMSYEVGGNGTVTTFNATTVFLSYDVSMESESLPMIWDGAILTLRQTKGENSINFTLSNVVVIEGTNNSSNVTFVAVVVDGTGDYDSGPAGEVTMRGSMSGYNGSTFGRLQLTFNNSVYRIHEEEGTPVAAPTACTKTSYAIMDYYMQAWLATAIMTILGFAIFMM